MQWPKVWRETKRSKLKQAGSRSETDAVRARVAGAEKPEFALIFARAPLNMGPGVKGSKALPGNSCRPSGK